MTVPPCPEKSVLFAYVDDELANDDVRAHVTECPACSKEVRALQEIVTALRVPVRSARADPTVRWLQARIAEEGPGHLDAAERGPRLRSRRVGVVATAGLTALAAAAAFLVVPRAHHDDPGTFTGRGGPTVSGARRDVAVDLDLVREAPGALSTLQPLSETGSVAHGAPRFLLSYATAGAKTPFHLLCFAVDPRGTVHWLYPAYEKVDDDPAAVVLPPGRRREPMSTEAWLDRLPPGRLEIHAVVSPVPLHVSDVEVLQGSDLGERALTSRFADADIRTWILDIEP